MLTPHYFTKHVFAATYFPSGGLGFLAALAARAGPYLTPQYFTTHYFPVGMLPPRPTWDRILRLAPETRILRLS